MENMDKNQCGGGKMPCGGGCGCGGGMAMGGCHGGKHHLVKVLLKLIIVGLIFMFGFNLGQTVGFIKGETGRGFGMMRGGNQGWGMMQYDKTAPAVTTPTK